MDDRLTKAVDMPSRAALSEVDAKALVARYGLRVPESVLVTSPRDAQRQLADLPGPWAAKIVSPDVVHKSDLGFVALDLRSHEELTAALREMAGRARERGFDVSGYLVERMAGPGHEVVVGGYTDPCFGSLIMFGLGGVFVEVLRDVSFRICPITRLDAHEMIDELKGRAILMGARGGIVVNLEKLVELLLTLGGEGGLFLETRDEFDQIDLNPVIIGEEEATVVDARFIFAAGVT